jgi:hypothetical protein
MKTRHLIGYSGRSGHAPHDARNLARNDFADEPIGAAHVCIKAGRLIPNREGMRAKSHALALGARIDSPVGNRCHTVSH